MDFFTDLEKQLSALYGRLSFSQKAAFVLLVAVVVGALVAFTHWGSEGEYATLTREPLGAKESEVLAALDAAGIRHRTVGGSLEVASSRWNEAMAVLATQGIVPGQEIKIRLADVVKNDSMFRTSEDKRAARLVALENWLADVIGCMENIRSASVALDAPDEQGFVLADEHGKAAVHVWLKPGVEKLAKGQVNGIAALVSGVRRTIKKSDVNIIDNAGHEYRAAGGEEGPDGIGVGDRQEQQMAVERELGRQVREMLGYYSPVKVMVRLKIDFDRKTEETVDVDPDKAVEVETRRESSEGMMLDNAPASSRESRYAKREIYRKVTHLVKAPGDILDLSVSVLVPREQVIEQVRGRGIAVDDKAADGPIAAELDSLRKSIANMLLVEKETNITVQAVTFPKAAALLEPKAVHAAAATGDFWSKNWRTLVLGALSLVALFFLWRMVKAPVEVRPVAPAADEQLLAGVGKPGAEAVRAEQVEQKVVEMVRKSPAEAAGLVSRWVRTEG